MATRIYNTTNGTIVEAEVTNDGQDFLCDAMGNAGLERSEMDDADFELAEDELGWWLRWAEREQRIIDTANDLGEDAIEAIAGLSAEYGEDMELLQDKEEEFLGIRGN